MTIEDDEIIIENLKAKLTLAQQSLKRTLDLFVQHGNREPPFGAVNDKLKRVLAKERPCCCGCNLRRTERS